MSAIATKKPYGDIGVQATFPYNFQKMFQAGSGYFPSGETEPLNVMVGTNFQSEYHELKRLEANARVVNRTQNNRSINHKLLTGPHNFHLPRPVLGQRLYANPSMGAESYSSTRRDNGSAAPYRTIEVGAQTGGQMVGGVLTTSAGYNFYNNKYQNRIGELNAMNALAVGNTVPMGQEMGSYDNTRVGPPNKVEFFILLRALEDAITEGDLTRFTFENLKDLIGKLFNMAPTASEEDFNDVIEAVDIMLVDLEQGIAEIADNAAHNGFVRPDYASTLTAFMVKIKSYTSQMMKNIFRSEKDKTTLSKSLVKSLGFDRLLRNKTTEGTVEEMRGQNARVDAEAENFDDAWEGGDDGRPYQLAQPREDEDQRGAPRAPLAGNNGDPERDRFGAQNGAFLQAPQYFQDAPGFAAPLALAGAEQVGEPQQRNLSVLVETAQDAAYNILEPQTNQANTNLQPAELVATLYPVPSNFVNELTERLEEQGFSPAEIAYALDNMRDYGDIFNEYIIENTGPLNQALIGAPDDVSQFGGVPPGPQAQQGAELEPFDYPATRELMREQLNTMAKVQAFGATIPRSWGGPYKPRSGSYLKSAHAHIIRLIKEKVPTY